MQDFCIALFKFAPLCLSWYGGPHTLGWFNYKSSLLLATDLDLYFFPFRFITSLSRFYL